MSQYTLAPGHMIDQLPQFPLTVTHTTQEVKRGFMANGIHIDRWETLEVSLRWMDRSFTCISCGKRIPAGQLAGVGVVGDGVHCADCVIMPAGLEAWRISYRQRKSRKNPNGIYWRVVISTPDMLAGYVQALEAALGREVTVEKLPFDRGM